MYSYGTYSFEENDTKIKVTTANGQDNVLFEDIASIGWMENFYTTNPHLTKGWIILIATPFLAIVVESWILLIVGLVLAFLLLLNSRDTFFDTISVETKGGKIISFDVPTGTAADEVKKIENTKRKITGVKN